MLETQFIVQLIKMESYNCSNIIFTYTYYWYSFYYAPISSTKTHCFDIIELIVLNYTYA